MIIAYSLFLAIILLTACTQKSLSFIDCTQKIRQKSPQMTQIEFQFCANTFNREYSESINESKLMIDYGTGARNDAFVKYIIPLPSERRGSDYYSAALSYLNISGDPRINEEYVRIAYERLDDDAGFALYYLNKRDKVLWRKTVLELNDRVLGKQIENELLPSTLWSKNVKNAKSSK
jgi:hypothetical protein